MSGDASIACTVIVPVYNEAPHLAAFLCDLAAAWDRADTRARILVLDDGSTDESAAIATSFQSAHTLDVVRLKTNRGKGAALSAAFARLDTPYAAVIDADNEYPPGDLATVLAPLHEQRADWVMGSRYGFGRPRPRQGMATYLVNRALTAWFNRLSRSTFHDMLTGIYAFRTTLVRDLELRERRFAYTPELLWTVRHRHNPQWLDVPVRYRVRGYGDGKKIRWWETFTIAAACVRYRRPARPTESNRR